MESGTAIGQKRALAVSEMNAAKQPFAACSKLTPAQH